jgi:hypothetical protein
MYPMDPPFLEVALVDRARAEQVYGAGGIRMGVRMNLRLDERGTGRPELDGGRRKDVEVGPRVDPGGDVRRHLDRLATLVEGRTGIDDAQIRAWCRRPEEGVTCTVEAIDELWATGECEYGLEVGERRIERRCPASRRRSR